MGIQVTPTSSDQVNWHHTSYFDSNLFFLRPSQYYKVGRHTAHGRSAILDQRITSAKLLILVHHRQHQHLASPLSTAIMSAISMSSYQGSPPISPGGTFTQLPSCYCPKPTQHCATNFMQMQRWLSAEIASCIVHWYNLRNTLQKCKLTCMLYSRRGIAKWTLLLSHPIRLLIHSSRTFAVAHFSRLSCSVHICTSLFRHDNVH